MQERPKIIGFCILWKGGLLIYETVSTGTFDACSVRDRFTRFFSLPNFCPAPAIACLAAAALAGSPTHLYGNVVRVSSSGFPYLAFALFILPHRRHVSGKCGHLIQKRLRPALSPCDLQQRATDNRLITLRR